MSRGLLARVPWRRAGWILDPVERSLVPWPVRALDLAIALLFLLWALSLLKGLHVEIGPLEISATKPARLAWQCAALALVRALVWRGAHAVGRGGFLAILAFLAVSLAAGGQPRRVGDGAEYLAMGVRLAQVSSPAVPSTALPALQSRLFPEAPDINLVDPSLVGRDGRQDFPHFWFYPLAAAPFVRLAQAVGLHPGYGFTALNGLLLIVAGLVALRHLSLPAATVIFVSPILWWVDKIHPEAFTFSLLVIALALLRDRPWWSLVTLAAASTQNPPFVAAAALAFVVAMLGRWRRDWRTWAGLVVASLVAVLHPLYYEARLGHWTGLWGGVDRHVPSWAEYSAVLVDTNIGLVPNVPIYALIVLVAVYLLARRSTRRLLGADVAFAAGLAALFLLSFSQSTNMNHGATFGPSRYILWLIPLAIPLFGAVEPVGGRAWRASATVAAIAALLLSPGWSPRQAESYLAPSRTASYLWSHWPALDNPLPEIFAERNSGTEFLVLPVGTPGCEKILFVSGETPPGVWPHGCPAPPASPSCGPRGAICYANRLTPGTADYEYVRAPAQSCFVWKPR